MPDLGFDGDRRFLRFAAVGGTNFLLGLTLFQASWHMGASLDSLRTPVAQTVAYAIGMAWSYYWNRKWVFRSAGRDPAAVALEAMRFMIAQLLCLLISILFVTFAVDVLHLGPWLGWVVAMAPLILLNFFITSRWVFASSPRPASESIRGNS